MAYYRKKPYEVQAIPFFDDAQSLIAISEFVGETLTVDYSFKRPVLKLKRKQNYVFAVEGDFLVKDKDGKITVLKPHIFFADFEEFTPEPLPIEEVPTEETPIEETPTEEVPTEPAPTDTTTTEPTTEPTTETTPTDTTTTNDGGTV